MILHDFKSTLNISNPISTRYILQSTKYKYKSGKVEKSKSGKDSIY